MASQVNFIKQVVAGKTNWKIRVRITNIWTVQSKNNGQDNLQVEMLLLDEKRGRILAVIPKTWVTRFAHLLQEGSTYLLEDLSVSQNDVKFKRTNHKFKLGFLGTTRVTNIDAEEIPINSFDFMPFPNVLAETRSDLYLDVIGHVSKKDHIKEKQYNGRTTFILDVVLEDLNHNMVKCTLWEGFAQRLHSYLEQSDPTIPVVLILQQCRLSKYLGCMGLSTAFFGTKMYINDALPEIADYTTSILGGQSRLTQPVTQIVGTNSLTLSDDLIQTRRMTIADLLEATQEWMGCVLVTVIEIKLDQGWAYNSCNQCFKYVKLVDNKFHCDKCKADVSASPRYKLHLQVIDETGCTTFTMFNTLVENYVGRTATDLIRSYENRPLTADVPEEFLPLIGKMLLCKVQIADINIRLGWQTFTVKRYTDEDTIIQRFMHLHKLKALDDAIQADEDEFHDAACELEDIVPHVLCLPANSSEVDQVVCVSDSQLSKSPDASTVIDLSESPSNPILYGKPVFLSQGCVGQQIEALFPDLDETPPTKNAGKRPVAQLDALDLHNMYFSPESATKLPRNLLKPAMKK